MRAVKEIEDPAGKQIIPYAGGWCGFSAREFGDDPLEKCWILEGRDSESLTPDAYRAESEALGRMDWPRETGPSES